MAVLPMERIEVCAMKRDRKRILELLQRRGTVEVRDAGEADEVFAKADTSAQRSLFEKNAATAAEAVAIVDKAAPEKGGGLAFLRGRSPVTAADNEAFSTKREAVLRGAQRVVQLRRDIAEARAEVLRAEAGLEALAPWMALPVPQTFKGTRKTAVFVGVMEGEKSLAELYEKLAEAAPALEPVHVEVISCTKSQTCLLVMVLKRDAAAAEDALRIIGFARPPAASHLMPSEKKARLEAQKAEALKAIEEAEAEIAGYAGRRADMRYLEDHMKMRAEKYEVIERLMQSRHVFVLRGYVPAENGPALEKELGESFECAVERGAAEAPGGEVPVKLRNTRFAEPTESIVESYSMPGQSDIDPTNVMAFFYYMMFGLMFGDAGYGLIMAGVCAIVLLRFKNMEPNWNRNVRMFFWCGIFTIFWGVVFSSYFGDVVDAVSQTFFGQRVSIPPLWFIITEQPMLMLMFCLGLGIIHLTMGFVMKGITNAKNGDKAGVIYDCVFPLLLWYPLVVLLMGSEMFAGLAGFSLTLPPIVGQVCLVLAGIAGLGIIFTGGRESRRWPIRLMKGAYALYNALSGWLSDTLSYARLLALGLASGVIASVMNQLGTMAGGGAVGLLVFVGVFLAGHAMNFGINVLGAYVHSNRLEYIEFFGKFYDGGGRKFAPFGIHTKHYKIVEEEL